MNAFIQIEFREIPAEQKDIMIARLIASGYEGFEETESGLKAFILQQNYDERTVRDLAFPAFDFTASIIEEINWNKVWESNFDPVVIDDFVAVRAHFHDVINEVKHEIIITPKMSFGTGHHATTYMMIQQMGQINFIDKTVLDFGTGTGVLAILAEKLGAGKIIAIDNDDWSIENARENIANNNCKSIDLQKAGSPLSDGVVDVILANINRNVILENFAVLAQQVSSSGTLLLSGLLKEDKDVIFRNSLAYSLQLIQTTVRDNWLCLRFSR